MNRRSSRNGQKVEKGAKVRAAYPMDDGAIGANHVIQTRKRSPQSATSVRSNLFDDEPGPPIITIDGFKYVIGRTKKEGRTRNRILALPLFGPRHATIERIWNAVREVLADCKKNELRAKAKRKA